MRGVRHSRVAQAEHSSQRASPVPLQASHSPPSRVSDLVHRGVSRTFQHVRIIPDRTVLENVALGAYAQGQREGYGEP